MGKAKSSAEANVFVEPEEEPEAAKPEKINLLDGLSLKKALDDAVIQAVTDAGYKIDYTYVDLKIVLGLLCCGLACLAQFFPKKHRYNAWVLAACVAAYLVLSTLMTVVAMVYEQDAIALTRPHPSGAPALAVVTRLPRYHDVYTLSIAPRGTSAARAAAAAAAKKSGGGGGGKGGGSSGSGSLSGVATLERSVAAYFHSDGHLAEAVVVRDVKQLLAQLEESKSK